MLEDFHFRDSFITSPRYNNPFESRDTTAANLDLEIEESEDEAYAEYSSPPSNRKTSARLFKPPGFGLNSLNEDESVVSFTQPVIDYLLLEVASHNPDTLLHRDGTVMKRTRWGTQRRRPGKQGHPARHGTLGRRSTFRKALRQSEKPKNDDDNDENEDKNESSENRAIYFNQPLPENMVDADGTPLQQYARNKIRTTKYTPLTFVPKNLYLQFRNVANIYFLVLIVLGFFSIFGVPNPGLATVPLIVIVAITAIKDAIEDSRRTGSDMEVNNTITHVLKGVPNYNVSSAKVSLWRRFKKLNLRLVFRTIAFLKANLLAAGRQQRRLEKLRQQKRIDSPRKLFESFETQARGNIQMDDLLTIHSRNPETDPANPFYLSVTDLSLPSGKARFEKGFWKDVCVGNILRIHNNDELPADMVILATLDADGACYVETKNLDGETNLKVRQALKCLLGLRHAADCEKAKFWVESEGPHANLYLYNGVCKYLNEDGDVNQEPITINNMLLRGCFLRNTKWAIGMVIFTGDDTKIMMNSGITPTKISRILRELNFSVFANFILLFVLCFIAGIVNGVYYNDHPELRDFYEFGTVAKTPVLNGVVTFFVAVILYGSLIPISLYISIEIIKTAQAFFIYSDVKMYYEPLDFPCTPKSWAISDDLGQIEYIFLDKTGTLTQNVMEFKKCTINGLSYGKAYTEALAGLRKRQGIDVEKEGAAERALIAADKEEMVKELKTLGKNTQFSEKAVTFVSSEFVRDLKGARGETQKRANEHFMLCLALCHSVLAEPDKKKPGALALKAQSPDESALVGTARDVGYAFIGRTKKGVILEEQGVQKEYQILNTLEFNSTRKRMSAIVKIPPKTPGGEPKALLICKGADLIIYSRLRKDGHQKLLEKTALHLEQYATEGLRTLCIAHKELSWSEYESWHAKHAEAAAAIENREEKMEEVADQIERDLVLLGGTAIEDRLQEGVSDSIALLARAGIKLWVLTGDKVETAINIGFLCNLLNGDMELLVVKDSGEDAEKLSGQRDPKKIVSALIDKYLDRFNLTGSNAEIEDAKEDHSPPTDNVGLVIDGDALKIALGKELRLKFLLLCKNCKAVLCCRVSPAQKALVVSLVKNTLDVMTLAIGDGSNDVAMIQAADVGVGIAGEEGRQAVMSSDYAIGQFRFLVRLILVHGRWSYKRLAEMIPCFFFKNVIFTILLFWYSIYSDFDGAYLFEYTYLMFYNLAFTSLPVIFLGIFDQDVSDVVSLLVPQLYRSGILRSEWGTAKFGWYMLDAFYQSVISFFFPYLVYYRSGFVLGNGLTLLHRYWMGCYVATILVVLCDLYILIHQYRWDWLSLLIFALLVLLVFGWTGVWSSSLTSGEFYKAAFQLYGSVLFWATLIVGIVGCLLPRFCFDVIQKVFWPRDIDIIRECVSKGDFSQYPDDYDPTDKEKSRISQYSRDSFLGGNNSSELDGSRGKLDPESRGENFDHDLVRTEEIQMDYVETEQKGKSKLKERIDLVIHRKSRPKTSLDITREEMLQSNELAPTMSRAAGRPSLELPGISVARLLVGHD